MTERIDDSADRSDETPKSGSGVGDLLRASRVRCGEDLPQVADALRIRLIYLEAIEDGRFADLPGPTYALGFVRTYANHLGLDVEEVIRRLRAETKIETAKPDLSFPVPVSDSTVPSGAVVAVGVIVAAVAYGAYLMGSPGDRASVAEVSPVPKRMMIETATANAQPSAAPQPDASTKIETAAGTPAAPPPAAATSAPEPSQEPAQASVQAPAQAPMQAAAPAPVASPSSPPASATPAPAAPSLPAASSPAPAPSSPSQPSGEAQQLAALPASPSAAPAAPAEPPPAPKGPRIEVLAKADSWIQVREGVSGAMLLTRLLRSGETYAVPDRSGLTLLTGNAGALEIRVDGEAVPALGPEGAVRRSIALDAGRLKSGTAAE